jgi:hypothetical protein
MFPALLAHPQEALNKRHLVNCVLCQLAAPGLEWNSVCVAPPEGEQVMLETFRGP